MGECWVRTKRLELESDNKTLDDSPNDFDSESDIEPLDDSVNDPDFMIENESSDNDVVSNLSESDVIPDSSSDTSDNIPLVQDLPALHRKKVSLDILKEAPF